MITHFIDKEISMINDEIKFKFKLLALKYQSFVMDWEK